MRALKPGLEFFNALKVDNGGAVNAHESCRVEFCLHLIHVSAKQMRRTVAVEPQVISFRFNPIQLLSFYKYKAAFIRHRNSFNVFLLLANLLQQLHQLIVGSPRRSHIEAAPGAKKCCTKTLFCERLEQVIQGLSLECLESVAIIGSDKDG